MAPNVRGLDKQKRKCAAATFKQNARTQKKRHNNKLATAAEGFALLVLMPLSAPEERAEKSQTILARKQWMALMTPGTTLRPCPIAT